MAALSCMPTRSSRNETDSETGEEAERAIPFMKGYTVFNVEQIDGLPVHYYARPEAGSDSVQRIARAESFFAATGANVVHGGSRACYVPSTDSIHMPCIDFFRDAESYYAKLAHETTHWTRHESRLNRDFGRKRFGDEGYAMEELVAELGAAFLAADLELTPEVRDDHAAYIASWIKALKDDKRAIFTASSHAQRAADFLHGLQPSAARSGRRGMSGRVMAKPDTFILDGHVFSWQRLCELRRQQLEAWKAARGEQPALFELNDDCRPAAEQTAAIRNRHC